MSPLDEKYRCKCVFPSLTVGKIMTSKVAVNCLNCGGGLVLDKSPDARPIDVDIMVNRYQAALRHGRRPKFKD